MVNGTGSCKLVYFTTTHQLRGMCSRRGLAECMGPPTAHRSCVRFDGRDLRF